MPDGSDDLKVLFPGVEVTVGDETLTVAPVKFGRWPKAVELLTPVIRAFNDMQSIVELKKDDGGKVTGMNLADDWAERIEILVFSGGEPLMKFLAFAVKKPREWLDDVDGDDGVVLAKAVFQQNMDFFNKRIMPLLPGVVFGSAETGGASLPNSSPPVIDGPTSGSTP